ncbi:FecR domain-containing protein [Anoxynatronum sibiricum]|uniref:FecR domain-containing protein n=1 Tax=Anoxynatronum sibiricum TaxID=210623 RepID=A0ABU9VYJ7_9CLOT
MIIQKSKRSNKQIVKRILTVLLCVSLLFSAGTAYTWAEHDNQARLISVEGDVRMFRAGGARFFDAYAGMRLMEGDQLITRQGATARIEIDDGRWITLTQNTRVYLSELRGRGDTLQSVLRLQAGGVASRIDTELAPTARFEISTPRAVMRARGTEFFTSFIGGETDIRVITGEVGVTASLYSPSSPQPPPPPPPPAPEAPPSPPARPVRPPAPPPPPPGAPEPPGRSVHFTIEGMQQARFTENSPPEEFLVPPAPLSLDGLDIVFIDRVREIAQGMPDLIPESIRQSIPGARQQAEQRAADEEGQEQQGQDEFSQAENPAEVYRQLDGSRPTTDTTFSPPPPSPTFRDRDRDADYTAPTERTRTYVLDVYPQNSSYGTVTGSGRYEAGERVTLTAVAVPGKLFQGWDSSMGNFSQNPLFITMPSRHVGFTALFRNDIRRLQGTAKLTGDPYIEETLTVNLTITLPPLFVDENALYYSWYRDGVLIPNAQHPYYLLTSDDVRKSIHARISSGGELSYGHIDTPPVTIGKTPSFQTPGPLSQFGLSVTETSIHLASISEYEYKLMQGSTLIRNWQPTGDFTGLEANTEYQIYGRYKETSYYEASVETAALSATTSKPTVVGWVDFGAVNITYGTLLGDVLDTVLPSTVTIRDSVNGTHECAVMWEIADYNETLPGSKVATGRVTLPVDVLKSDGEPYNITKAVTVKNPYLISAVVGGITEAFVPSGTSESDAISNLADKVHLSLINQDTYEVNISWEIPGYDPTVTGIYPAVGTYALPAGVEPFLDGRKLIVMGTVEVLVP